MIGNWTSVCASHNYMHQKQGGGVLQQPAGIVDINQIQIYDI